MPSRLPLAADSLSGTPARSPSCQSENPSRFIFRSAARRLSSPRLTAATRAARAQLRVPAGPPPSTPPPPRAARPSGTGTRGRFGSAPPRPRRWHRAGRRADLEHPFGRRGGTPPALSSDSSCSRSSAGVGPTTQPVRSASRPRSPFWNASLNVRRCHRLANRLHLGGQRRVGGRELLEREARDLHHHVVEHGLERRRRDPGDVVGELVQPVADGQLGADPRDGKPGGLRRERRRPRDPRVHLDDELLARRGVHGELDVAPAGGHADFADDPDSGVAHDLVTRGR